ncbi:amino acid ABC transporter substrate-binding protein [Brevibacillus marinus]|uniref:amino acid ABC transporter substrate-binding protein n=1 Tax=Brevibacillus marinus TaxID=2496837 RepID=UPI000F82B6B7|nr:amino acid ABC transporter substrate-binding protein [Brevibacillus marinus]
MKKKWGLWLSCLVMVLSLMTGCNSAPGSTAQGDEGQDRQEIKIGMTVSTTGSYAFASQQGMKGVEIWADHVNEQGGIFVKEANKKLPVKLVYYEDRSDKQQVTRLYEKLINEDKVDMLIAPFGSTLTGAAATVTEKYKKPLIIWSAASDSLYEQGYRYVISATQISASLMPRPEIAHIKQLGLKKVAIVYLDEAFPAAQAEGAKKYAEALGLEVVHYEKFSKENLDYASLLRKIDEKKPDALYVSAYMEEQANFIKQMKEMNIMYHYVYMLYSAQADWLNLTGDDGLHIIGHTLFDPNLKYDVTDGLNIDQFMEKYNQKYKDDKNPPDFQTALAYGAGVMMQKYLEEAGSFHADAIKRAALDLSGKVTILTGEYRLAENGAQEGMEFVLTQVKKDEQGKPAFRIIYPESVKTEDPILPIPKWDQPRNSQ